MKQITMDATIENMPAMTTFVEQLMEEYECPMKVQIKINVALDELLGNIAHYAYKPEIGPVTIQVNKEENPEAVAITIIDHGVPYNPLEKNDPDTTLSVEDREIGGLGIYMVKKSMDEVNYTYQDQQNILTIKKHY